MSDKLLITTLKTLQQDLDILKTNKALPESILAMENAISIIKSYEQVKWERDCAIQQLEELGTGLGEMPEIARQRIQEQKWISVEERLPEEKINPITNDFFQYPVIFKSSDVMDVRYYKFGHGHWFNGCGIMDSYVIAWFPILEYHFAEADKKMGGAE